MPDCVHLAGIDTAALPMSLHHKLASHKNKCCVGTAHQASPYYVPPDRQWVLSGLQATRLAAACNYIAHHFLCSRVG